MVPASSETILIAARQVLAHRVRRGAFGPGELAWVTLYENLNSSLEGQNVAAMILTTNIFRKGPDGWRMIHHHGSSVAQPPQDQTPTVH